MYINSYHIGMIKKTKSPFAFADHLNNGPNGHLFYVGGDLMMRRGMLPIIMLPDGDLRIALHLVPFWILTIWGSVHILFNIAMPKIFHSDFLRLEISGKALYNDDHSNYSNSSLYYNGSISVFAKKQRKNRRNIFYSNSCFNGKIER